MSRSLAALFAPCAVAVVGAAADPSKVGGSVLAGFRAGGFAGRIVPVNRARAEVQGLAAVVNRRASVRPAPTGGPRGRAAGLACRAAAPTGRPEHARLDPPRAAPEPLVRAGNAASGADRLLLPEGSAVHGHSRLVAGAGPRLFAVREPRKPGGRHGDRRRPALADDPETRVIVGYVEGVEDGGRLFEAVRAAARRKPCVLLKAGRSTSGARAVSSHTGALPAPSRPSRTRPRASEH